MVLCHLPDGPTAHFKVSSVRLRKEIKASWTSLQFKYLLKLLQENVCSSLEIPWIIYPVSLHRGEVKIQPNTRRKWSSITFPPVWDTPSPGCSLPSSLRTRTLSVDRSRPSTTREILSSFDSTGKEWTLQMWAFSLYKPLWSILIYVRN